MPSLTICWTTKPAIATLASVLARTALLPPPARPPPPPPLLRRAHRHHAVPRVAELVAVADPDRHQPEIGAMRHPVRDELQRHRIAERAPRAQRRPPGRAQTVAPHRSTRL